MQRTALILFLDFDGVLNNENFLRHQKNHVQLSEQRLFDPLNIKSLNTLCNKLPIEKIVISSTWRKNRSINDIRNLLFSEGFLFTDKIYDVTPVLGNQYEARADEIQDWILKNETKGFIILDDCDLTNSFGKGYYHVNSLTGLTDGLVVSIFNGF